MTTCHECNDTGERDSGGTHPWGEPVYLPCDCKDAEIGRRWREDSSLEKWFPMTAERLAKLEAENAALKREAYTWSKAAETYAKQAQRQPLTRQQIDDVMTQHYPLSSLLREEVDAFEACVRDIERLHGIGA